MLREGEVDIMVRRSSASLSAHKLSTSTSPSERHNGYD